MPQSRTDAVKVDLFNNAAQLECDPEKYQPLLHAFKGFVAQQQVYATHRQLLK
jgi:hypothetical protein